MKGVRHMVLGMIAASVVALVGLIWLLQAPAHADPQSPVVLPGGVVVYHSPGTRVSFFGLERMHAFDIGKYDRIAADLVASNSVPVHGFGVAAAVTDEELAQIHDASYLRSLYSPEHLSRALEVTIPSVFQPFVNGRVLAPFRRATGATVAATRDALRVGAGINLGGGYHHARPKMGHGFCIYGDIALAVHTARQEGFSGTVLIVDTDAHQGDGNHAFFADDPSVISFSIHGGALFPHPKLIGDRDVEIPAGIDDEAYLSMLASELEQLLETHQPGLVFHVAGADVLRDDPLANLNLTPDGLVRRDRLVAQKVRSRGAALVHTLAGGYGPSAADAQARSIRAIIETLGGAVSTD